MGALGHVVLEDSEEEVGLAVEVRVHGEGLVFTTALWTRKAADAFTFAIVACLVAAAASLLRGGRYHHAEDPAIATSAP